jgi:hypothetical protein
MQLLQHHHCYVFEAELSCAAALGMPKDDLDGFFGGAAERCLFLSL